MSLPVWSWIWAWRALLQWARLDLDPLTLSAPERWQVVTATIPAGIHGKYWRPFRHWLLVRLPSWLAVSRLERHSRGWYRIPTWSVAEHCMFRFGHPGLDVGTFLKITGGTISATGHVEADRCELLLYLPDGQVEDEPHIPSMSRAWSNYLCGSRTVQAEQRDEDT